MTNFYYFTSDVSINLPNNLASQSEIYNYFKFQCNEELVDLDYRETTDGFRLQHNAVRFSMVE